MNAHDILENAAQHMKDRAATYDKPQGERSMSATVEAFNAVTNHQLTEEQGWLFMVLLKAVRSQQGSYRADSYEDGAAYFALAGETAAIDRKENIPLAFDEERIDIIATNGNNGEHYGQVKAPTHIALYAGRETVDIFRTQVGELAYHSDDGEGLIATDHVAGKYKRNSDGFYERVKE